jgi:hypothetical protein
MKCKSIPCAPSGAGETKRTEFPGRGTADGNPWNLDRRTLVAGWHARTGNELGQRNCSDQKPWIPSRSDRRIHHERRIPDGGAPTEKHRRPRPRAGTLSTRDSKIEREQDSVARQKIRAGIEHFTRKTKMARTRGSHGRWEKHRRRRKKKGREPTRRMKNSCPQKRINHTEKSLSGKIRWRLNRGGDPDTRTRAGQTSDAATRDDENLRSGGVNNRAQKSTSSSGLLE